MVERSHDYRWDIFVSHATEDKNSVVRPLVEELVKRGLVVWYDEHTLTLGDSLRKSIDAGLAKSRYGVVVLSHAFFAKNWPQVELDGLVAQEDESRKVILPVWHEVTHAEVAGYSPTLAGRLGVATQLGVSAVADKVVEAINADDAFRPAASNASGRGQVPRSSASADVLRAVTRDRLLAQFNDSHILLKYKPAQYVRRSLEETIERWLKESRSTRSACSLVIASAGCGKTNLLCKIAANVCSDRPTFFSSGALLQLDQRLGLWTPIAESIMELDPHLPSDRVSVRRYLEALSFQSEIAPVIIIDAINEFHDPPALKRELRIFLRETKACGFPVIVSCRDYYWGLYDAPWWLEYVKTKTSSRESSRHHLGNFRPDEARQALSLYFQDYEISAKPQGNALEQFKHPLLLRFFCETYRGNHFDELKDIRLKSLFDHYWKNKLCSIAERMTEQGEFGIPNEVAQYVGHCLLEIARHMLDKNKRFISARVAQALTRSSDARSFLQTPYGRILDEHIILEQISGSLSAEDCPLVAFVFEEFMEYAMARSIVREWRTYEESDICKHVVSLTKKYDEFSQIFGVILYAALMVKEERGIDLWPALIGLGDRWHDVILEAFRKLPSDQVDDAVFAAIVDLLRVSQEHTRIQALELLKFGRLGRVPTPELTEAVGNLVMNDALRIRRRAIHALAVCPPSFSVPLIERGLTSQVGRAVDLYRVVEYSTNALARIGTTEALIVLARAVAGYWHGQERAGGAAKLLGTDASKLLPLTSHSDPLVRIGAIILLGHTSCQQSIPILQHIVARDHGVRGTVPLETIPSWVDNPSLFGPHSWRSLASRDGLTFEAYLAQNSLKTLRVELARISLDRRVRSWVREAIQSGKNDALPHVFDEIDDSHENDDLIRHILKSGLEYRSGKKWTVLGGILRGFTIKATRGRLSNKMMTLEDRNELANLLDVNEVPAEGLTVPWKRRREFVYRSWGQSI